MIVIIGCAGEPIRVEFPINHPANPGAHETEFTLPRNPFQSDAAGIEKEPEKEPMMQHEMDQETGPQHPDHNMGTDKEGRSKLESTINPAGREDQNQHKEHSR